MDNLFKKVACFTDIHFGNKSNSKIFNQDCDDFIDWFIDIAHKNDCETCIFLGDWHHHRSALNVDTMDHSLRNLIGYNSYVRQRKNFSKETMIHKYEYLYKSLLKN